MIFNIKNNFQALKNKDPFLQHCFAIYSEVTAFYYMINQFRRFQINILLGLTDSTIGGVVEFFVLKSSSYIIFIKINGVLEVKKKLSDINIMRISSYICISLKV